MELIFAASACDPEDQIICTPASVNELFELPFLGGVIDGVQYPRGSLAHEQHVALGLLPGSAMASLSVYPVQLYESVLLLGLFLILRKQRWHRRPAGWFALLTACSYAAIRFFLDYLRADGAIVLGNLTVTQLQCLILFAFVVLLPDARRHRHPRPD